MMVADRSPRWHINERPTGKRRGHSSLWSWILAPPRGGCARTAAGSACRAVNLTRAGVRQHLVEHVPSRRRARAAPPRALHPRGQCPKGAARQLPSVQGTPCTPVPAMSPSWWAGPAAAAAYIMRLRTCLIESVPRLQLGVMSRKLSFCRVEVGAQPRTCRIIG